MASRTGAGKVRHMDVRHLWLQGKVRRQELCARTVGGDMNPADILTKPKGLVDIGELAGRVEVRLSSRGTTF